MKNYKYIPALTALLLSASISFGQLGVGTTTPHPSAELEVQSSNKGVLIPRLAMANRPASPVEGLMIYQTDNTPGFYYYDGTDWERVGSLWKQNGSHIYSDNNVAINKTTPTCALDVYSGSSPLIANLQSNNVNGYVMMSTDVGYKGYYGIYSGADDMDFGTGAGNTTGNVNLVSQSNPVLTATSQQRVGIGTTIPQEKLEVNGAIKIADAIATPADGTIRYTTANGFEGRHNGNWEDLATPPAKNYYFSCVTSNTITISSLPTSYEFTDVYDPENVMDTAGFIAPVAGVYHFMLRTRFMKYPNLSPGSGVIDMIISSPTTNLVIETRQLTINDPIYGQVECVTVNAVLNAGDRVTASVRGYLPAGQTFMALSSYGGTEFSGYKIN